MFWDSLGSLWLLLVFNQMGKIHCHNLRFTTAAYGYNFLKFGFKISNEVQIYQDDWGKPITTISDYPAHVCRPVIIDAQGRRNLIISYSTKHESKVMCLLNIWNLKDFNGVFGVFNCQGAGWCKVGKKNLIYDCQPGTITGIIHANDVNYLPRIAHDGWTGDAILYSYLHRDFVCLPTNASIPITMNTREYEIFAVVPIKKMSTGSIFSLIGLVNMFNSG
ncbi:hypothetical protein P3S67_007514 [Capsicum chacoense]